jgi:hypothetical protein
LSLGDIPLKISEGKMHKNEIYVDATSSSVVGVVGGGAKLGPASMLPVAAVAVGDWGR